MDYLNAKNGSPLLWSGMASEDRYTYMLRVLTQRGEKVFTDINFLLAWLLFESSN